MLVCTHSIEYQAYHRVIIDLLSRVCHESVFTQLFLSLSLSLIYFTSHILYISA